MRKSTTHRNLVLLYGGSSLLGSAIMLMVAWAQHLSYGTDYEPPAAWFLLPAAIGTVIGLGGAHLLRRRMSAEVAALHDPLTGLPNRAAFQKALAREISRSERYGGPLGLVLFDIDKFKSINDVHGHTAGDRVLQGIARSVSAVTRKTDLFARWAGDEFVLLAPGIGAQGCRALAEKVRAAVASHDFGPDLPVTVSLGVAHFVAGDDPSRLLDRADEALYTAKRSGRNRAATTRCLRSTGTWTGI